MLYSQTIEELVADDTILPEEMVLAPWLPAQGLAMIAGWRGVGKTMFALGCAFAIAAGDGLLGWTAQEARNVLYVDGEMALAQMQTRARELLAGQPQWAAGASKMRLLSHAMQEDGIPNLIRYASARKAIEQCMEEHEAQVLFLDNLSALCNSDVENDVESWTVMQHWLLDLRRKGKTVVFLHHAGKPNEKGMITQRGTSKREDVLNSSILLRGDGANGFRIIYDKHRGFEPRPEHLGELVFTPGSCVIREKEKEKIKVRGKVDLEKIGRELS